MWRAGVNDWDEFLARFSGAAMHKRNCAVLETSRSKLEQGDATFFAEMLPRKQHWRAFPHFSRIAYLDIETTGISKEDNDLTVIGLFDGKKVHSYIRGRNLDDFKKDIKAFDMVVTFNGSVFDVPFLQAAMPGVKIPALHMDLRFVLNSLGLYGGLKSIEKQFGFERESDLRSMNGYGAVLLWQRYRKHGDEKALDKLVRYNAADISNLKKLAEWAYIEKRKSTIIV